MSAQQSSTSHGRDAEASAQRLLADEERAKAKAAAKKAKKQKQKAKKSQPASPDTADTNSTDHAAPVSLGTSAQLAASADAVNGSADADGVESTAAHVEQLSLTARTSTDEDAFLEQLFCCPLTKVSACA